MSNGFGTAQPVITGNDAWAKEVRLKEGDKVQFIPLHGLNECLTVLVHGKTVKIGNSFRWVPSGARNEHLLDGKILNDPFDNHPDKDMRNVFPKRFMLVYVVKATGKTQELTGKVGFIEVKSKNTFSTIRDWEAAQVDLGTGQTIAGKLVAVTRKGSGQKTTEYQTTVIGEGQIGEYDQADVEKLKEYLLGLYVKPLTEDWLKDLYQKAFVSGSGPLSHVETTEAPDVAPEPDIQF